MTCPVATASPVARLISIRSASRREEPRVISTLPVAMVRSTGTWSMRSAMRLTSPPTVLTLTGAVDGAGTGADGWASADAVQSQPASSSTAQHARVVEMSATSSSRPDAISRLFDGARPIALTDELGQDVSDEEEGAGHADDGGSPRVARQRERLGGGRCPFHRHIGGGGGAT